MYANRNILINKNLRKPLVKDKYYLPLSCNIFLKSSLFFSFKIHNSNPKLIDQNTSLDISKYYYVAKRQ